MTVLSISRLCARANRRPWVRIFLASVLATRRERAALSRLDARALSDIGLSRAEADSEANRPIWDVPATWRR